MKKSVKIAIGVFFGLMVINGCTHTSQPTQQKQTVCQYENDKTYKINGNGTGSNPVVEQGTVFNFNTKNVQTALSDNGKTVKVFSEMGTNKALYLIDTSTFDKAGWDKVLNKDNYYQVDNVETMRVTGLEALNAGIPNIEDVTKVYTIKVITAHAVHHHTEGDK